MSPDLTTWLVGYQQAQRWLYAGCCEQKAEDLFDVLRHGSGPGTCADRGRAR